MAPKFGAFGTGVVVHFGVVFELVAHGLFERGLELPHLGALGVGMLP